MGFSVSQRSKFATVKQNIMNKVLLSLLGGVVIGLLVAPDSGSETLRKLRSRVRDYKDQVEDGMDELAGKGKNILDKGQSKLGEAIDR
jgi:gas vesicle protein